MFISIYLAKFRNLRFRQRYQHSRNSPKPQGANGDSHGQAVSVTFTKTVENASMFHAEGSVTVGVASEAGAVIAKAKASLNVTASWGGEWSKTISTSDTLETATSRTEGESESITATIGDHGEEVGTYRYALFGVTDFYVLYKVNKNTGAVEEETPITCARASTYAWGIDFDSSLSMPTFGKTGSGAAFESPAIDFTKIAAPTEEIEEPPAPPSQYKNTSMTISTGELKGNASKSGGDGDVNSQNGRKTNWEFEVQNITPKNMRTSGSYSGTYDSAEISFSYTVKEGQKDWTVLTLTTTYTVDLSDRKVTEVTTSTPQKLTGTISGKHHDWVTVDIKNEVIKSLRLKIDDNGDDNGNIAFDARLDLNFVELNS
jgi:hypothetical protein